MLRELAGLTRRKGLGNVALTVAAAATPGGVPYAPCSRSPISTQPTNENEAKSEPDKAPLSKRKQFKAISPKPATMRYINEFGLAAKHVVGNGKSRGKYDAKMKYNQREKLGLNRPTEFSLIRKDPIEFPILYKLSRTNSTTEFPDTSEPEVAFIGRSNVGKSSLLNAVIGATTGGMEATGWALRAKGESCPPEVRKRIARFYGRWMFPKAVLPTRAPTSSVPGTTRSVDFYRGDARLRGGGTKPIRVIDVPGYGYADATHEERMQWLALIKEYLTTRPNLKRIFLLLDARFGFKFVDKCFLRDMGRLKAKIQVVLTKCDYIGLPSLARRHLLTVEEIKNYPNMLADVMMVSSATGACMDILRRVVLQAANISKVKTLREAREDWAPTADPWDKRKKSKDSKLTEEELPAKAKMAKGWSCVKNEEPPISAYRYMGDSEKFKEYSCKEKAGPSNAATYDHRLKPKKVQHRTRNENVVVQSRAPERKRAAGLVVDDGDEDNLPGEDLDSAGTGGFSWDDQKERWVFGRKTTATGGWNVRRRSGYGDMRVGMREFHTSRARGTSADDASDVLTDTASWSVKSLLATPEPASCVADVVTHEVLDGLLRLASFQATGGFSPSEQAASVTELSTDVSLLCHFVRHIQEVDTADVAPLARLSEEWGCRLRPDVPAAGGGAAGRKLLRHAKKTAGEYYVVDVAEEAV